MPQLILRQGRDEIARFPLDRPVLTIGRGNPGDSTRPDIDLPDKSLRVSRLHGAFVLDRQNHYWIVDLASANGTEVNGSIAYRQQLSSGDVVRIGAFHLIYTEDAPQQSPLPSLIMVDDDVFVTQASRGHSTVVADPVISADDSLATEAQAVINEITTRLEHVAEAASVADEVIKMFVKSLAADCGFIAILRNRSALVPISAFGMRHTGAGQFAVSQDCVARALAGQSTLLSEFGKVSVICCATSDRNNDQAVIYLQGQSGKHFDKQDRSVVDALGKWLRERWVLAPAETGVNRSGTSVVIRPKWSSQVVAVSEEMKTVLAAARRLAKSDVNVLLLGPTGTGKEVLARYIHDESPRSQGPYIIVELSRLEENHAEGELFGWRKGAFTGAVADRKGAFELAEKGTLFLDEIGDISLNLQAKLRRAVENKEYKRLGADESRIADTRLVAATNVDLDKAVQDGSFRDDLLMRFGSRVYLPSLKERTIDIPLLVYYFLDEIDGSAQAVSHGAMKLLIAYDWPGNVRELREVINECTVDCDEVIFSWDLPEKVRSSYQGSSKNSQKSMKDIEKDEIMRVLYFTGWNVTEATRVLGYKSKQTLYNKMKAYEIKRP